MVPLIVIVVITILNFLYARKWGIVAMTSGALGIAAGLTAFFYGINLAPGIAEKSFDAILPWAALLVIGGVLGVVSFFIVWAISLPLLKLMFKESSILYKAGRGISGGFLSILASAVVAFLILNATRITGTVFELDYVDKIAAPEIAETSFNDMPQPSKFIKWRNDIEKIPEVVKMLDFCDPFSRLENRNFGMVTIFSANQPAKNFSEDSSQMASILSNSKVKDWLESSEIKTLLNMENDRVALVLGAEAMEVASHPDLRNRLRSIDIDQHIEEFFEYLQTLRVPSSVDVDRSEPE